MSVSLQTLSHNVFCGIFMYIKDVNDKRTAHTLCTVKHGSDKSRGSCVTACVCESESVYFDPGDSPEAMRCG